MKNSSPTWQSTVLAALVLILAIGTFLVVFLKSDADEAIKVWGALGTVVGAMIGAFPAYFFGQQGAQAAKEDAQRVQQSADLQAERLHGDLRQAHELANEARLERNEAVKRAETELEVEKRNAASAERRADLAQQKAEALIADGSPTLLSNARKARPDLPW